MKTFVRILTVIAACSLGVFITGTIFSLRLSRSGKPATADLVRHGCYAYLRYAAFAATNGEFHFTPASFSEFAKTNFQFSQVGNAIYTTGGVTNGVDFEAAARHSELHGSVRAIFNANQDFWARTSFSMKANSRELVIVCKQPVEAAVLQSFLGWRWLAHKTGFVAVYSDGTTDLLSPAQFKQLDLSSFIPLSSLGVEGFHVRFKEQSPER